MPYSIASLETDEETLVLKRSIGLLHEVLLTTPKVGATRDFFSILAHNPEKFRKALDAVYNEGIISVRANNSAGGVYCELETYSLPNEINFPRSALTRFSVLEFPTE